MVGGQEFYDPPGTRVEVSQLRVPKVRELAVLLANGKLRYTQFVECRALEEDERVEVVVFDAEVELPQRRAYDIRRHERLAVTFGESDSLMPVTLALRRDFPEVPHLNIRPKDTARSLCLSDEPYPELKVRWTSIGYIERVREWLSLTARGVLHDPDQPLEPFLLPSANYLIIPPGLLEHGSEGPQTLALEGLDSGLNRVTLQPIPVGSKAEGRTQRGIPMVAVVLAGQPQEHGLIRAHPRNIDELHDFLLPAGLDLRSQLADILRSRQWTRAERDSKLVLIAILPQLRKAGGEEEGVDLYAFLCLSTIEEVGVGLNVWQVFNDELAQLLGVQPLQSGEQLEVAVLNPVLAFSRTQAAAMHGLEERSALKLVAVGVGALGSQVFLNLMRSGFGEWTVIDDDILLPHNMARHALFGNTVGFPKAAGLAVYANFTIEGPEFAKPIVANVLNPGLAKRQVADALAEGDVLLDMSASVAVARYLAHSREASGRRVSLFLNPSGSDLVLLAEDCRRAIPLDLLEMQYYRALINDVQLRNHLLRSDVRVRYGRSCRDVSSTISQDLVAMHAAIGSRMLRRALSIKDASASVWQVNEEDLTVQQVNIGISPLLEQQFGEWTLKTDQWLLDKAHQLRADRSPHETGGVLIGAWDMERHIVYAVDLLASPPDSIEWPTMYIRGCEGLRSRVQSIAEVTMERLEYIGEWHSHPDGHSCNRSVDDYKAFAKLGEQMQRDGLLPLMLIVGEGTTVSWYLDSMK